MGFAKVMKAPRKKIERRRLTGKTPALTAGCYAGESASDVARTSYWCQFVRHDPVHFLGAESVFEEYDAKEQARREANRDREMLEFRFAKLDERRPKHNDYFYTGDEIIRGHSDLTGRPFRDAVSLSNVFHPRHRENLKLVTRYRTGTLVDRNAIDLARFIEQEYESGRYHYC